MRLAVLAHGKFPDGAKTAVGLLRYSDHDVVAVLDRDLAADGERRVSEFLPDVQDAPVVAGIDDVPDIDAFVVGIAPIGGGFDETWRDDVAGALERGCDVWAGLHYFLSEDEGFAALAEEHDCELWDVRDPPEDLTVAEGVAGDLDATVVTTVGTDCSVGKMTATLELLEAARDAGLNAGFVPTGQTGIMIEGWGIPIDRTISDFTAGAVERMLVERAEEYDYLFVEGQGSIVHPAYSAVTCGILHGSMPDHLVLCHEAGREVVHGYEAFDLLPADEAAALYESLAAPVHPASVVGGAVNTSHLDDGAARAALSDFGDAIDAPAVDPVRFDASDLVEAIR
ncbi:DUF1611 domain-containing protein [Halomarina ordinaria]|uniref:DUF1611 domain-containing protein n=1 Tax=Halomarina ordinaria TaxID=3033939 RepID=A0ABD5U9T9_9EURY|nr:DUF1611 domain-containing protein [Halomarina sp. PSRA2]